MQIDTKKCLRKRDVAKKNQKRCAEKRKNEDRICLNSNGKKYILGHNWKSSQRQESQDKSAYDSSKNSSDKSAYDSMQIDTKKCLQQKRCC